jgi:hypothetical protein
VGAAVAGAGLQKKAKRFTQKATKDAKRWGTNLEGRTNLEGQVKYCREVKYCRGTFFGHATPDRAGARPYVRLRVRTNRGVEVPIGQNTGCP